MNLNGDIYMNGDYNYHMIEMNNTFNYFISVPHDEYIAIHRNYFVISTYIQNDYALNNIPDAFLIDHYNFNINQYHKELNYIIFDIEFNHKLYGKNHINMVYLNKEKDLIMYDSHIFDGIVDNSVFCDYHLQDHYNKIFNENKLIYPNTDILDLLINYDLDINEELIHTNIDCMNLVLFDSIIQKNISKGVDTKKLLKWNKIHFNNNSYARGRDIHNFNIYKIPTINTAINILHELKNINQNEVEQFKNMFLVLHKDPLGSFYLQYKNNIIVNRYCEYYNNFCNNLKNFNLSFDKTDSYRSYSKFNMIILNKNNPLTISKIDQLLTSIYK